MVYKAMSLNQIIDKAPLTSLVCDQTLKLKAEQLRVLGDVTAATFNGAPLPTQTVYSIPYTVKSLDGSTEYDPAGTGLSGNMTFVKIGRVVSVHIPVCNVTGFGGGAATQSLRYVWNSALPAALVPTNQFVAPFVAKSSGAPLATPGLIVFTGNLLINVYSNYSSALFTATCGVVNGLTISYISA